MSLFSPTSPITPNRSTDNRLQAMSPISLSGVSHQFTNACDVFLGQLELYLDEKAPEGDESHTVIISLLRHILQLIGERFDNAGRQGPLSYSPLNLRGDRTPVYGSMELPLATSSPLRQGTTRNNVSHRSFNLSQYSQESDFMNDFSMQEEEGEQIPSPSFDDSIYWSDSNDDNSEGDRLDENIEPYDGEMTLNNSTGEQPVNEWEDSVLNRDLIPSNQIDDKSRHCREYNKECMICTSNLDGKLSMFLPCYHILHTTCLEGLANHTTRKQCPTCKQKVEDVRSLTCHTASPILGMDHKSRQEIMQDILNEPQSPGSYIGRKSYPTRASRLDVDNVKKKLFTEQEKDTPPSQPLENQAGCTGQRQVDITNTASTSGQQQSNSADQTRNQTLRNMKSFLGKVYNKANMDIFNRLLPENVLFDISIGGQNKVQKIDEGKLVYISLKLDHNLGTMVTNLMCVMKKLYMAHRDRAGLTQEMQDSFNGFLKHYQRNALLFSSSFSDESDSDEDL